MKKNKKKTPKKIFTHQLHKRCMIRSYCTGNSTQQRLFGRNCHSHVYHHTKTLKYTLTHIREIQSKLICRGLIIIAGILKRSTYIYIYIYISFIRNSFDIRRYICEVSAKVIFCFPHSVLFVSFQIKGTIMLYVGISQISNL